MDMANKGHGCGCKWSHGFKPANGVMDSSQQMESSIQASKWSHRFKPSKYMDMANKGHGNGVAANGVMDSSQRMGLWIQASKWSYGFEPENGVIDSSQANIWTWQTRDMEMVWLQMES